MNKTQQDKITSTRLKIRDYDMIIMMGYDYGDDYDVHDDCYETTLVMFSLIIKTFHTFAGLIFGQELPRYSIIYKLILFLYSSLSSFLLLLFSSPHSFLPCVPMQYSSLHLPSAPILFFYFHFILSSTPISCFHSIISPLPAFFPFSTNNTLKIQPHGRLSFAYLLYNFYIT